MFHLTLYDIGQISLMHVMHKWWWMANIKMCIWDAKVVWPEWNLAETIFFGEKAKKKMQYQRIHLLIWCYSSVLSFCSLMHDWILSGPWKTISGALSRKNATVAPLTILLRYFLITMCWGSTNPVWTFFKKMTTNIKILFSRTFHFFFFFLKKKR